MLENVFSDIIAANGAKHKAGVNGGGFNQKLHLCQKGGLTRFRFLF
jgi:hypothetical protein